MGVFNDLVPGDFFLSKNDNQLYLKTRKSCDSEVAPNAIKVTNGHATRFYSTAPVYYLKYESIFKEGMLKALYEN